MRRNDLLIADAGFGNRLSGQRPIGNEAFDRMRPADRLYRPPLALGALFRAVRSSQPQCFDRHDDFAVASGSEGEGGDKG